MNRKLIWVALCLVVAGALFIVFLWWRGDRQIAAQEAAAVAAEDSFMNDEDGDGLAGWEEDLWHTDRTKSDTDGDNMLDGEEVKLGRNPRQAGDDQTTTPEDKTILVATNAMVEKQAPLVRLETSDVNKSSYTLVDLKLVSGESAQTLAAYKAAITKLIADYTKDLPGDEQEAMYQAMDGNAAAATLLQNSRQHIQTILGKALVMPVPVSASLLHLNFVNALASLGQIIYNMSQVASEPLLAVESVQVRNQKYLNVISAISALDRYLTKNPNK